MFGFFIVPFVIGIIRLNNFRDGLRHKSRALSNGRCVFPESADAQCYLPSKIFSFETSLATANICHEKRSKLNIIL